MNKVFMEWDNGPVAIKHVIKCLKDTKEEFDTTAATCYSAFHHITSDVKSPCRAVGVARKVLEMHNWDVNEAIKYLED